MRGARALLAGLALASLAGAASAQRADNEPRGRAGEFDLYVLALSWSPTFCLTDGQGRDSNQCAPTARRDFVVHGLWPQYERGWPQFCGGRTAERVPDGTISRMLDIMPDRGLVIHQWRKHGTCSGLGPQAYFDTVRRAAAAVRVPDELRRPSARFETTPAEVEAAFTRANPGITADMMTVTCQAGMLDEVRVCLSRTLQPRRCAEVDARSCRGRMSVPPSRGAGG
jgi:ribonuclease T2